MKKILFLLVLALLSCCAYAEVNRADLTKMYGLKIKKSLDRYLTDEASYKKKLASKLKYKVKAEDLTRNTKALLELEKMKWGICYDNYQVLEEAALLKIVEDKGLDKSITATALELLYYLTGDSAYVYRLLDEYNFAMTIFSYVRDDQFENYTKHFFKKISVEVFESRCDNDYSKGAFSSTNQLIIELDSFIAALYTNDKQNEFLPILDSSLLLIKQTNDCVVPKTSLKVKRYLDAQTYEKCAVAYLKLILKYSNDDLKLKKLLAKSDIKKVLPLVKQGFKSDFSELKASIEAKTNTL